MTLCWALIVSSCANTEVLGHVRLLHIGYSKVVKWIRAQDQEAVELESELENEVAHDENSLPVDPLESLQMPKSCI